jgi:hypothetical protein
MKTGFGLKWIVAAGAVIVIAVMLGLYLSADSLAAHQETRVHGLKTARSGSPVNFTVKVVNSVNGAPVKGAKVRVDAVVPLLGETHTLFEGKVDSDGTADVRGSLPANISGDIPVIIRTESPLGSDELRQTLRIIPTEEENRIYLTSDRRLYQPKQKVHLRAFIQERETEEPLASTSLSFNLKNDKGNPVASKTVNTNSYGLAWCEFKLPDDATLGVYTASCRYKSLEVKTPILVREYVMPKFALDFEQEGNFVRPGTQLKGTLTARYPQGGAPPVKGKVDFRLYDQKKTLLGSVTDFSLSEDGETELWLDVADAVSFGEEDTLTCNLEVKITDKAGQTQIAFFPIIVARQPVMVELYPESGDMVRGVENIVHGFVLSLEEDKSDIEIEISHPTGDCTAIPDESGYFSFRITPRSEIKTLILKGKSKADGARLWKLKKDLRPPDGARLLLRQDKAWVAGGEKINCEVFTGESAVRCSIFLVRNGMRVAEAEAVMENGKGLAKIETPEEGNGFYQLVAFASISGRDERIIEDVKRLYIQPEKPFALEVRTDSPTYLPGEKVILNVKAGNGEKPGPLALAVAVADKSLAGLGGLRNYASEILRFKLGEEIFSRTNLEKGFASGIFTDNAVISGEETKQGVADAAYGAPATRENMTFEADTHDKAVAATAAARQKYNWYVTAAGLCALGSVVAVFALFALFTFIRRLFYWLVNHIKLMELAIAGIIIVVIVSFAVPITMSARKSARYGPTPMALSDADFSVRREAKAQAYAPEDARASFKTPRILADKMVEGPIIMTEEEVELLRDIPRGTAFDNLTNRHLSSSSVVDAYGVGGGAAGAYGQRWGRGRLLGEKSGYYLRSSPDIPGKKSGVPIGIARELFFAERKFFPECLYYKPFILTDESGKASVEFKMADTLTTWKADVIASSAMGKITSASTTFASTQPFAVDIDVPAAFSKGDATDLKIVVINTEGLKGEVMLVLEAAEGIESDDPRKIITLTGEPAVMSAAIPIKVTKAGNHELTVTAITPAGVDKMIRKVRVYEHGQKIIETAGGLLSAGNEAEIKIELPEDMVEKSRKIFIKINTSGTSIALDGLESMLRTPHGCFEQTSSIAYPNIMVAKYFADAEKPDERIMANARGKVQQSYDRLRTFEVTGGGFSLYGKAPASTWLSAYGLMQFSEMRGIVEVSQDMMDRTARFIARMQNSNGSWAPYRTAHFGQQSDVKTTAYCLWAITEANADAGKLDRAVKFLRSKVSDMDLYTLALSCAATKGDKIFLEPLRTRMGKFFKDNGASANSNARGRRAGRTLSGAHGIYANIEMVALAAIALADKDKKLYGKAVEWLIANRRGRGGWGTTQGTVLALKAILKGGIGGDGKLVLDFGGGVKKSIDIAADTDAPVLVDISDIVPKGNMSCKAKFEGKGKLDYQVTVVGFRPWGKVIESKERDGLNLSLAIEDSFEARKSVEVAAKVLNHSGEEAVNVMLDIPLLPGVTVDTDTVTCDLDGFIQKAEVEGESLIIYGANVPAGKRFSVKFSIQSRTSGKFNTRPAKVFEYYNPSNFDISVPKTIDITKG